MQMQPNQRFKLIEYEFLRKKFKINYWNWKLNQDSKNKGDDEEASKFKRRSESVDNSDKYSIV